MIMSKVHIFPNRCRALILYAGITLAGLAADLLSKHWVFQTLGLPGEYKVETEPQLDAVYWIWKDVIGFQTALNTGGLFGFGAGQTTFLAVFSAVFLAGIIGYVIFWAWRSLFLSSVLGMLTAGICGNLYDRLGLHGLVYPDYPVWHPGHPLAGQQIFAVRDWILCMIGTFPWPNFNIADSLLVCSITLLLLHELFFNKANETKAVHTSEPPTPAAAVD